MQSVSAGTRAVRTSTTVAAPSVRSVVPRCAGVSAGKPGGGGSPKPTKPVGSVSLQRAGARREGPLMPLPDFLIAGVPKAGTTALHAALAPHPGLYLSPVKEPKFFLSDGPPPRHGGPGDVQTYQEHVWRREEYEALFARAPEGALLGEATPFYLHDPGAHARIKALVPQTRLVLLLRDPVDRAHSNWTHLWNAGL